MGRACESTSRYERHRVYGLYAIVTPVVLRNETFLTTAESLGQAGDFVRLALRHTRTKPQIEPILPIF